MFDTKKFGKYLAFLRKNADMTQSALADKLSLTRQAVSNYEVGESFPDVSILSEISEIFGVTVDDLINSGEPTRGESKILKNAVSGEVDVSGTDIKDVVSVAPYLKPSVLGKISESLASQGIDISHLVDFADYLNSNDLLKLMENDSDNAALTELIDRVIPFLDGESLDNIFDRILRGELDWKLLRRLLYCGMPISLVEAAVLEGCLPYEALKVMEDKPVSFGKR